MCVFYLIYSKKLPIFIEKVEGELTAKKVFEILAKLSVDVILKVFVKVILSKSNLV